MFCINCGKELNEGTRFCVYCGSRQEAVEPQKDDSSILDKFTVLDIVIMFLYGVIAVRWFLKAVSNAGYVWSAYAWIYDSVIVRILFTILFLAGSVLMVLLCVVGIRSVIIKKYHISISLFMTIVCLIFRIIAFIISKIYWPDALYGVFYIITIYSNVYIFTLIISLINSVLLYSKNISSISYP